MFDYTLFCLIICLILLSQPINPIEICLIINININLGKNNHITNNNNTK